MGAFWIIVIILVAARIAYRLWLKPRRADRPAKNRPLKPMSPWQRKLYTVWVFFIINMRRLFRDRLALFFTFLFPLIFLFVFGAISRNGGQTTFHVAVINDSHSQTASQLVSEIKNDKIFKIDNSVTNLDQAKNKMSNSQIDGTIVLPSDFGTVKNGRPAGQMKVYYSPNNQEAGQALTSVLQAGLKDLNAKYVDVQTPFVAVGVQTKQKSLTSFDYAFTGLLGFAILGAGIFGPMNVFPELKKMGILRRLHTTPLRVWQYFLSIMMGNAVTGLMSIAVMFVVAIAVFNLTVVGSYLELAIFLAFGIIMILGIGLSLGGWARNERQAAPLGNIIVFPMMFLSGVFFPRFLMPEWLQGVTAYMPLTPVIDGARLIVTEGKSLVDLGPQLAVMAVWTIVIYIIAFRVFRWE